MNRRIFLTSTTLAAAGLATGLSTLGAFAQETNAQPIVSELVLGDPDAPVELMEYASYTCPHCARFHAQVLPDLKANYIDTGKVKLIYREVYFDRPGLWASMMARCGGDRYFGIQKILYDEQSNWARSPQVVEELRNIGRRAGLSNEVLDACFQDAEMAQAMIEKSDADMSEYNIRATPTLVLNGKVHSNMSYNDLKKLIDKEL